jgi:glycosyltransferase involved in cell wall biosynthesis
MSGTFGAISVVIPAYYAEATLPRAVRSVLAQSHPATEIVVVADETTDGTAEAARAFGEPVRFFHQKNAGVSAARNLGTEKARGEWIAFLDADDWWEPHRLESQVAILKRHPELMWASGSFIWMIPGDIRILYPPENVYANILMDGCYFPDFYEARLAGVMFHTTTMLIRRAAIEEVGLFDTHLAAGEDRDMWYRLADRFRSIGYVTLPVSVYDRRHESALDRNVAVLASDFVRVLIRFSERGPSPDRRPWGVREKYLSACFYQALRQALVVGDKATILRILGECAPWLRLRHRALGAVALRVPGGLLRAAIWSYQQANRLRRRILCRNRGGVSASR